MTYATPWKPSLEALTAAGVQVRTYASTASLYIHAKMILVDGREAFIGSENFSPPSLESNRELGLTFNDAAIMAQLQAVFTADWNGARLFKSLN